MHEPHNSSNDVLPGVGRRTFLAGTIFAGIAAATGRPARAEPRASLPHAKNLILLIVDGMSLGTLQLAQLALERREGRSLHWVRWMAQPGVRTGLVDTRSADAFVTDSAASASAWSIGEPVRNGAVCVTPDGRSPLPLFRRTKKSGRSIGLVSNTSLWDATPGAMLANAPKRNLALPIAEQLCAAQPDLMLGGGAAPFSDDLLAEIAGARIVRDRAALLAASDHDGPLIGLFADSSMNYCFERTEREPTLSDMAAIALRRLPRNERGFALLIEGARVDHAAHRNDAATLVQEMIEFDDVVGAAIEFCAERDDTLLIVTTDHANANPGLTIYGERGIRMFDHLAAARHSTEWMIDQFDAMPHADRTPDSLADIVRRATGFELSDSERRVLARSVEGDSVHPFITADKVSSVLGLILANHHGIAFVSPNHTSDHVIATAQGPGSERLAPIMPNTELHTIMASALDLPTP